MMEKYESDIEEWYNHKQNKINLADYLCKKIVLKSEDSSCLNELIVEDKKSKGEKSEL